MRAATMRFGRAIAGACALAALPRVAIASAYTLDPVRIQLSATQPYGEVTLRNESSTPISMQVDLERWRQLGAQRQLQAARNLLASPPLFVMAPGRAQIVRFALRHPPAGATERAWRVSFSELPSPSRRSNEAELLLRTSIALFYRPAQASPAQLRARATRGPRQLALQLRNDGGVHLEVVDLRVRCGHATLFDHPTLIYLLPGGHDTLELPLPPPVCALHVDARTDAPAPLDHARLRIAVDDAGGRR